MARIEIDFMITVARYVESIYRSIPTNKQKDNRVDDSLKEAEDWTARF
jgi:hypothetical protein